MFVKPRTGSCQSLIPQILAVAKQREFQFLLTWHRVVLAQQNSFWKHAMLEKSWNRLAQKRCWSSKTPTTVFQSSFQTAMCLKPHKIIRNTRTWTFWGRKHMVLKLPLKKNKLLDNSWNCSEQKTTGHLRPQSIPWTFILNRPLVFFTNTFANRKHEAKDCPKGGVVSQVRKPFSFQRLFSFKPIPMSFACAF